MELIRICRKTRVPQRRFAVWSWYFKGKHANGLRSVRNSWAEKPATCQTGQRFTDGTPWCFPAVSQMEDAPSLMHGRCLVPDVSKSCWKLRSRELLVISETSSGETSTDKIVWCVQSSWTPTKDHPLTFPVFTIFSFMFTISLATHRPINSHKAA